MFHTLRLILAIIILTVLSLLGVSFRSAIEINLRAIQIVDLAQGYDLDGMLCDPTRTHLSHIASDQRIDEIVDSLQHLYDPKLSQSERVLNLIHATIQFDPQKYGLYLQNVPSGETDLLIFRDAMSHFVYGNRDVAIAMWADIHAGARAAGAGDVCRRLGRDDLAADWYQIGIKTGAQKANVYFALGMLYYEHEEFESAATQFQLAVNNGNQAHSVYEYAGASWAKSGNYRNAIDVLKDGLDVYPASVNLLLWYGHVTHLAEQYIDSAMVYKELLAVEPRNVYAYLGLVRAYLNTGQRSAARKQMREMLQILDEPLAEDACISFSSLSMRLEMTEFLESVKIWCPTS